MLIDWNATWVQWTSCFYDLTSCACCNLKYKSPCVCSFIFFLQFSYRSICSSKKFIKALEVLQNVIPMISAAYLEIFNNPQSNREFFGLRDFYRYTYLSSMSKNFKTNESGFNWNQRPHYIYYTCVQFLLIYTGECAFEKW